ncbi:mandelate racemase/muconate lactonizing enzyme family protein [Halalkalicoccus jeotgali]|uniref:Mandelate racemase/muconate lactonizing protein n=1 Tax=Halalkalicoccus jeotgali (strain DSM 18796 / CECT 7217 / JCM 14584 / KCTC 4019 / B3) TaxID=795797 RepID=D8JBV5_HALJB|nr:mandelate racemase/muconate lactonizing enzyme family protein [Halalkalicoccus jeotgali]ADJ16758.1 mandelate racemase/muconate lactonizing protein [Halalkalicoccus jeotgali B3]ELY40889.1 mandelate racemase/muconate lactonizing protein [Halalkalicoccus jeotgali B3]
MRIEQIEPIVLESAVGTVSMPGGKNAFNATVTPVVAKVHTDEGIIGLGETYLDDPSGHKAMTTAKGIEALGHELQGSDPRDVTDRWHEMYVHVKREGSYRAMSAIDEALWDIKGKDVGEPVYELLGGKVGQVKAYATFPLSKPADQLIEDAQWLYEKGFPTMKIVAGRGVTDDQEKIKAVAENIPKTMGLAIDSNTTYDVQDAMKVGEVASDVGLEWFEEPVSHTNIQGQAQLNRDLSVPISAYQNHLTHYPAVDHLEANALEIYQPALDFCGGITAAQRVGTMIEPYDKKLVLHAFGPVINYSASLHVAAACPVSPLIEFGVYSDEIDDPGEYLASPYVDNQTDIYVQDGGIIEPPEKPGLGLELDDELVEEYRLN